MPLLLYMLLVGPVTQYFVAGSWRASPPRSFAADWLHHMTDGEVFSESGPLWFCLVLLSFCGCFALFRAIVPAARTNTVRLVPDVVAVAGYGSAMAALTFAIGVNAPLGGTILSVDLHDFPQYPLMFIAGVMAWRKDWPLRIAPQADPRGCSAA